MLYVIVTRFRIFPKLYLFLRILHNIRKSCSNNLVAEADLGNYVSSESCWINVVNPSPSVLI